MVSQLRAIMAGCGAMSPAWINASKTIPGLELVAFVDIQEAAAQKRAAEYGGTPFVGSDLEAAIAATQADMVFDCTVPSAHHDVTLTALRHGCHVLGEKPMADSMEQAREMVAAAQKSGKLYAVLQNRRFDPNIRRLRHLVNAGALGALTTIHCDFFIGAHFGGFRDHMEHILLVDMAIHTFDAARFISGADPVSVYCKEWNPAGSWYDQDASAIAIFEMSDGIVYSYRGSWCSEGLHTTWESDWRVVGQNGTARWDGTDQIQAQAVAERGTFISKFNDLAIAANPEPDKVGGHTGVMRDFVNCVRNGGTPDTICTDNIKSLAMVFGAVESAETGRQVDIRW